MLRRTHLEFIDSIEMLREKNFKKYTEIFTSDGERIGVALRFVHRPIEDVDPMVRLYRTYLIVQSVLLAARPTSPPSTSVTTTQPPAG